VWTHGPPGSAPVGRSRRGRGGPSRDDDLDAGVLEGREGLPVHAVIGDEHVDVLVDAMFEGEKSVFTYMGNLLAIPHGTNEAKEAILRSALSVVRYDAPIDWDGNEVRFAVGVAGIENGHLEILGSAGEEEESST
jgi:PTS system mannitol-specific IIA component